MPSKRILIITNNARDANLLAKVLNTAEDNHFSVEWLRQLSAGIERIKSRDIDAIVVDLSLPDSHGIATFDQLFAAVPHTPIVILTKNKEEGLAIEAMKRGAHGYLSQGHFINQLVPQTLRNIIQRKTIEESFYKEKTRAEIALNSISDAVICTDLYGNIDYLNIAAESITGWQRDEASGLPIEQVFKIINSATREPPDRNPVHLVLEQDEAMGLSAGTLLIRRDGREIAIEDSASPIHNWDGDITGAVIVFHDVSAALSMTLKMAHLAQHDFLTNLPNRLLLNDRIAQAITLAKRNNKQVAILFLDLDNFKHINDSLGHAIGDKLLQSVTQRLKRCVRSSDTVSRQGGDEFVILLSVGNSSIDTALTADKILSELSMPHAFDGSELHITTSIGISIYPEDGNDAETLIKNADTAMYHAKENGRNNYQFFRNDMNTRAMERILIETNLRHALDRQEFTLLFQPKINLNSGEITGVEALLRWNQSEWGEISPDIFVPIAEDCGLIVTIGHWVLLEACKQAKHWVDAGLPALVIAVNISAMEFHKKDFVDGVRTILKNTGLEARYLELEITESVLMSNAESSKSLLYELKDIGVRLAVDDFGTGYSSLSYLKQFPLDVLKIDQSFVNDIGSTGDSETIICAIISMGNSLKLRVIAEGVENAMQLEFLKIQHCEEGQGYLFSRPLTATNFSTLLMKNNLKFG